MTDDPYQVLGVAEGVTPDELKKAYRRKVREHSPEDDPEGFQRVQQAFETASAPDYPDRRKYGGRVDALTAEAEAMSKAGDWAGAARKYKEVLVLMPEAHSARNSLGICHTRTREWEQAKKVYAKLVGQKPEVVFYRNNYAWVFIHQANSIEGSPPEVKRLAAEGRAILDDARKLEPDNPDLMDTCCRLYQAEQDWEGAIEWAEKAVAARPGPTDVDDVVNYALLYLLAKRRADVGRLADRLAKRLTADDRRGLALRLAKYAIDAQEGHRFVTAHAVMAVAARLDPDDENIRAVFADWDRFALAADEFDRLNTDSAVARPVVIMCALLSDRARNVEPSEPYENQLREVGGILDRWDARERRASARRVQAEYPNLYSLAPGLFDEMAGGPPPKRAKSTGSGGKTWGERVRGEDSTGGRTRGEEGRPRPSSRREPDPPRPSRRPEPRPSRYQEPATEAHRGGVILGLALFGLFCCPLLGVAAIPMGGADLGKMSRGAMDDRGRGMTVAGVILGVFACLVWAFGVFVRMNLK